MPTPPMELGDETPTALYRLYAVRDRLLYVGISEDLKVRFATHAALKPWWPDVARKTAELYTEREEAAKAELAAIKAERPLHNVQGQPSGPFGVDPGDLPEELPSNNIVELVMMNMPPQSLRLALLELAGIPTRTALDMLGVGPTHRYRVINQLRAAQSQSKPVAV